MLVLLGGEAVRVKLENGFCKKLRGIPKQFVGGWQSGAHFSKQNATTGDKVGESNSNSQLRDGIDIPSILIYPPALIYSAIWLRENKPPVA